MLAGRSPFDIVTATDNPDQNTEDYLFQGVFFVVSSNIDFAEGVNLVEVVLRIQCIASTVYISTSSLDIEWYFLVKQFLQVMFLVTVQSNHNEAC